MLANQKLLALGLTAIPTIGAALLLSTAASPAHAACANTGCSSPESCTFKVGVYCTVAGGSCVESLCC